MYGERGTKIYQGVIRWQEADHCYFSMKNVEHKKFAICTRLKIHGPTLLCRTGDVTSLEEQTVAPHFVRAKRNFEKSYEHTPRLS